MRLQKEQKTQANRTTHIFFYKTLTFHNQALKNFSSSLIDIMLFSFQLNFCYLSFYSKSVTSVINKNVKMAGKKRKHCSPIQLGQSLVIRIHDENKTSADTAERQCKYLLE